MGFKEKDRNVMIKTGEWLVRQNMTDGPFRENLLEVFGMLRELIPLGLLSHFDHIMLTNELIMPFVEVVRGENINKLVEAERSVRKKIETFLALGKPE